MYQLTDTQINSFHQKGWLGPLNIFSAKDVEPIRIEMEKNSEIELVGQQKIRNFHNSYLDDLKTPRHHHLWNRSLCNLFKDEKIVHPLNQLGEENLLLWRTRMLHRMPGQGGIGWHQSIEYYGYDVDESNTDLVFPKDEKILNLTVWIALADITPKMGIIQFANGSHQNKFKPIKVPPGKGVYQEEKYFIDEDKQYSKSYAFDENEWNIESIPVVKAGQVIIFTEQVMHQAPANHSSTERWAINGRYISPRVTVYPQRLTDARLDDSGFDLAKHFCILVSGKDDYGINKIGSID